MLCYFADRFHGEIGLREMPIPREVSDRYATFSGFNFTKTTPSAFTGREAVSPGNRNDEIRFPRETDRQILR